MVSSPAFSAAWPKALPIGTLNLDIHGRAALNPSVVHAYAAAMRAHQVFPAADALDLHGTIYVVNGHHRVAAAQLVGDPFYSCRVLPASTKADVIFAAALAHARDLQPDEEPFKYADKRHIVQLVLPVRPEGMNDTLMGRLLHVRRVLVTDIRNALGIPSIGAPWSGDRKAKLDAKRASIAERLKRGEFVRDIVQAERASYTVVADVRRSMAGVDAEPSKAVKAVAARRAKMKEMAEDGSFTIAQIAQAVHMDPGTVNDFLKKHGLRQRIRHRGGQRLPNATRIVSRMAEDAGNLTADVSLIDFEDLDLSKVDAWLAEFKRARRALTSFMERLAQVKGVRDGDRNGDGV